MSQICASSRAQRVRTLLFQSLVFIFTLRSCRLFFRLAPSPMVPKPGQSELAASQLQPSPELNAEGRQRDPFDRTVFIYSRQMGLKRLRIPNQHHYFPPSKRLTSNRAPGPD